MILLSQKLSELWSFSWVKSRWNLKPIKLSNLKISLIFWDLDQIFFLMWNQFIFLNAYTNFQGQRTIWRPQTQYGFLAPPPESIRSWGAMVDRVKGHPSGCLDYINLVLSTAGWRNYGLLYCWRKPKLFWIKMQQRQDNASTVCDCGMDILTFFVNLFEGIL